MPELPEVDAARASIHEHFAGQRVVRVQAFQDDKVMEGTDAAEIERIIGGRRLVAPRRKGKHLWFEMEGDHHPMPLFHLGMAGAFEIRGASVVKYKRAREASDDWPPKWCKVSMEFEEGGALAFVDSRRFGRIRVVQQPLASPPISELGWDALDELPSLPAFATLLQSSQRVVKAVLLDQAVLCGIGNWIADEVLFQARVHPESRAKALSEDDLARLHKAINHVLSVAVSVRADCSLFPPDWLFHKRWNKVPGSIFGHKITFITSGGRTSAVVPALQGTPRSAPRNAPKEPGAEDADGQAADPPAKARKKRPGKGKGAAQEEGKDEDAGTSESKEPPAKSRTKRAGKGAVAGGVKGEEGDAGARETKEAPAKPSKRRARKGAEEGDGEEGPGSNGAKPPRKRGRASHAPVMADAEATPAEVGVASAEAGVTPAAPPPDADVGGMAKLEEALMPFLRRSTRSRSKPVVDAGGGASVAAGGSRGLPGAEKSRGGRKRRS